MDTAIMQKVFYPYRSTGKHQEGDDGMKGIMSKDILGTPTPIRFEDEEVWGVQKYDAYLSQKYGDYMTIPKQSGQRQHNFHYLDLNKPYRNFEV